MKFQNHEIVEQSVDNSFFILYFLIIGYSYYLVSETEQKYNWGTKTTWYLS